MNVIRKLQSDIYQSGEILGVKLLDHVVIGDQRYISFKEQGMMPEECPLEVLLPFVNQWRASVFAGHSNDEGTDICCLKKHME